MDFKFEIKERLKLPTNVINHMEIRDAMRRSVFLVWSDAQSHAPVDTGNLRGSFRERIAGAGNRLRATIIVDADYAPHLEYGTRYIKAGTPQKPVASKVAGTQRPYLRSALYRNEETIVALFKGAVRKVIK